MKLLVVAGYAALLSAMVAFQAWGVVKRRTMTAGDLVGLLVRPPAVRWLLITAWLWWGWHVFVRVDV